MLPGMFLHTPLTNAGKQVAIFEFKTLHEGLKFANSLTEDQKLMEVIDFAHGGSAVIASSSKPFKKTSRNWILKERVIETLKIYYKLTPYKVLDHFLVIENISFQSLFEVLDFCSNNGIEVVDIKNQRVYRKNSLLLSYDNKNKQISTLIKKFKGKKIEKLSPALRDFFHVSKPV